MEIYNEKPGLWYKIGVWVIKKDIWMTRFLTGKQPRPTWTYVYGAVGAYYVLGLILLTILIIILII